MTLTPDLRQFDVLTFGDLCVDLILSGADVTPAFGQVEKLVDNYTLEMGGSCSIFACQAARLGLRTAILGRVGADSFGQLVLDRLRECGVDTRYVLTDPSLKTGLGLALCPPGDRAVLTYVGTINAVRPEDVTDEILATARHLHHGSYYLHTHLQPRIPAIFERAHRLGLTTSLDPNWDPEDKWNGGLEQALPHTDLFMPNDQEAAHVCAHILGLQNGRAEMLPEAERWHAAAHSFLDRGVRIVTLKAGAKGAWVVTPETILAQGTTPVTGGDSIGAGDSFDAGFLAGWLRGLDLEKCLALATACGRSVAGQVGGLAGQLTWEAINR